MDVTFANWQISVHRAGTTRREQTSAQRPAPSAVERQAQHARQARSYEQQREAVHCWTMLHGGR
ncbi:MAG: hypothetical protein M3Z04_22785 [Chloroflexota bacterium]|nr:hypothetical protein [Chloroflexota bacterium]